MRPQPLLRLTCGGHLFFILLDKSADNPSKTTKYGAKYLKLTLKNHLTFPSLSYIILI